jgi:selenocysteine lyase/cysteine desulfurase
VVCRHGSFLAPRLLTALGVKDPHGDGILRFSLAHYNTVGEVERLIEVLEGTGI